MNDEERYLIADYLTKTVNNEMGRREQLEIIRILNPDAKLSLADPKFIFGINIFIFLSIHSGFIIIYIMIAIKRAENHRR